MPSLNGNRGFSYSSRSTDKNSCNHFVSFSRENLNNVIDLLLAALNIEVLFWQLALLFAPVHLSLERKQQKQKKA